MKCPIEMIVYMHEYLDDEIPAEHERELRDHVQSCLDCKTAFSSIKKDDCTRAKYVTYTSSKRFYSQYYGKPTKGKAKSRNAKMVYESSAINGCFIVPCINGR